MGRGNPWRNCRGRGKLEIGRMVSRISPRYWSPANRNITDHRGAHTLGDEPLVHGHLLPLLAICVDVWIRPVDGSEIESNKVGATCIGINVAAAVVVQVHLMTL